MIKKFSILFTVLLLIGFAGCDNKDQYPDKSARDAGDPQLKSAASANASFWPLFQLFLNKTNTECDQKINSMVTHFFSQTSAGRIYYESGTDKAYIYNVGPGSDNNDVRSEGMSYGMMVTVQLDMRNEFDKLWKWAKTYMLNTSGSNTGYFAWRCNTNGTKIDANPAPDGEEYFAMALYFAYNRWGDAQYRTDADAILTAMLSTASGHIPMFGSNNLVCFQPVGNGANFTDPSYHLPAFYELFAEYGPSGQSSRWRDIAAASRVYLKNVIYKQSNGLVPDYSNWDGTPTGGDHQDFRYDAWRTAMNVVIDATFFPNKSDAYSPPIANNYWYVDNLLEFFESKGVSYPDRYKVATGESIGTDHSAGLIAMNAVAARAGTSFSQIRTFANELWNLPMPTGDWRYYNGCLYMFGMLFSTGNYNIYDPGNTIRILKYISPPVSSNLSSKWSGKHLTVTGNQNNADVKAQPENSSWTSQNWLIEPVPGTGYCRLKNVWSGKYLNVQGQDENAKIVCYELHEDWLSEQWIVETISASNSAIRLRNVWANKYLTVENTGDYANIICKTLNTSWASQEWITE